MRKTFLAALFLVPCLGSCAIGVGAVAGGLLLQETNDNSVYIGQLNASGATTWAQTKVTLSNLSLKPITVDNEAMKATAEIDDAKVTVECSTYDLNKSEIRVSAKKYMVNNGQIAKMVFDKIVADLGNQR
ncbi:MAG: hypothetical protein IPJ77_13105 [Planctomycetes bacterium]|nr:hypothetical protein [Planctomycetota bacterium]